jgi:hypothetical protein
MSSKDKETAINAFRKASSSEQSIYEYASQYRAVASVEMRGVVYAVLISSLAMTPSAFAIFASIEKRELRKSVVA